MGAATPDEDAGVNDRPADDETSLEELAVGRRTNTLHGDVGVEEDGGAGGEDARVAQQYHVE